MPCNEQQRLDMAKYDPDKHPAMIEKLTARGFTNEEICDFIGIALSTLTNWRIRHEEFGKAFKVGSEEATARVERSLYERAIGMEVKATKVFFRQGDDEPTLVDYIHIYPPDPGAAKQFLSAHDPEKWTDKAQLAVSGKLDTGPQVDPSKLSDEELVEFVRLMEKARLDKDDQGA